MSRLALVIVAGGLGCGGGTRLGQPAQAELIPRDVLFQAPERRQVRLSPDGTNISWIASTDGPSQLWVAPSGNVAQARAIGALQRAAVAGYEWARGGRRVLYSQDRGDGQHVYSHDVATGTELDLTPFAGRSASIASLTGHRPNEIAVIVNGSAGAPDELWRIDVNTGGRARTFVNAAGIDEFVFDHDLVPRIGLRHDADGSVAVLRLAATGVGQRLLTIPVEAERTTSLLGFDHGNGHAFLLGHRGADKSRLVRIDLADGRDSVIAEGQKADIHAVTFDPRTGAPDAYAEHYFRDEWFPLSAEIRDDLRFLSEKLESDFRIVDRTTSDDRWLLMTSGPSDPGMYLIYDREARSVRGLFAVRPGLRAFRLERAHLVEVTARDGLPLAGYLTLPPGSDRDGDGRPTRPVPLVVNVHGGPWSRSTYTFNAVTQFFANRGYAVLDMNYRGSKGYGARTFTASFGEWGGAMIDDLVDAARWAASRRIAPPEKIAIYGHSYGGFATLAALAFAPEVFACGAEYAGPTSLFTQVETFSRTGDSPPVFYRRTIGDPESPAGRERMRAQSPALAAERISSPVLIAHGSRDRTVGEGEADQMVEALRQRGKPVTYLSFPDEGHNFTRPENQLALRAVMEGFLAQCLGGSAEPFGGAFERSSMVVKAGASHVRGLAEVAREPASPDQ